MLHAVQPPSSLSELECYNVRHFLVQILLVLGSFFTPIDVDDDMEISSFSKRFTNLLVDSQFEIAISNDGSEFLPFIYTLIPLTYLKLCSLVTYV